MVEYVAFDNHVETRSASFSLVFELAPDRDIILGILNKHNIDLEQDVWHPQQQILDAYREISELGNFDLIALGMRIPDALPFPPHIDSVETALSSLDEAYHMNHRGGDIGEYVFEKTGDRSGKVICCNPYPSDLDYGLIYRMVKKFRDNTNTAFSVKRDPDAPSRKNGDDSCTFLIEW